MLLKTSTLYLFFTVKAAMPLSRVGYSSEKKMLLSLLRDGFDIFELIQVLMMIPIVLFSLSFHEFSHGFVAYKCGDHTARNFGRLTLNPTKHLDPIGALMMLFIGFGWAKPVPVNTRNFKNPKRDFALVALAGPVSNLLLALVSCGILCLSAWIFDIKLVFESGILKYASFMEISNIAEVILTFFYIFTLLNIGLAVFNLIPLPPLDGSRLISAILPPKLSYSYDQITNYSRYILLFLVLSSYIPFNIGRFSSISDLIFYPLDLVRELIMTGYINLFSLIFGW